MFSIIIHYSYWFLIIYHQYRVISSSLIPKYWLQHSRLPEENRQELFYFYLKQKNHDLLNDHLQIASDPTHRLYHKTSWLTLDQINKIVRPDPLTTQV